MKLSYDEISPITKNKSVLVEYTDDIGFFKMCMESGYSTQEDWVFKSDACKKFNESAPDVVRWSQFVDMNTKQVWYRLTITSGTTILYPDEYDGDYIWKVGKYRFLNEGEVADPTKLNQVVGDKVRVIDDENAAIFEDEAFSDAYDLFNKLCNDDAE